LDVWWANESTTGQHGVDGRFFDIDWLPLCL